MAASVLNTPRAIEVSVFVVRAFVGLRQFALAHDELARLLADLEKRVSGHDETIRHLVAAIRQLANPPKPDLPKRHIGFRRDQEGAASLGKLRGR